MPSVTRLIRRAPTPAKFVPPRLPDNYVARTRLLRSFSITVHGRGSRLSARRPAPANQFSSRAGPRTETRIARGSHSTIAKRCRHTLGEPLRMHSSALSSRRMPPISFSTARSHSPANCCPRIPAPYRQRVAPVGPSADRQPIPSSARAAPAPTGAGRDRGQRVRSCDLRSMRPPSSSSDPPRTSVDLATLIEHVDGWATGLVLALSGRSATMPRVLLANSFASRYW